MLVLSGSSHPKLAAALAKSLSAPLARRTISRFPDQTFRIRINSFVKRKTVVIVQTLVHPVHDHLIELLLLAAAAKSAGAKKIIAVIPYLAYSRQNKIFLPGEPLSARVIAQMLSAASIDEIITLDLHHSRIAKFFSVPIHNLSFLPTLIDKTISSQLNPDSQLKTHNPQHYIVVAPDRGAASRARLVADRLKLPLLVINKHRDLNTGKISIERPGLAKQGQALKQSHFLLVDDLIVTGDTLVEAAKFLKSRGAKSISIFATHGLFTNGFKKLRSAGINSITISDSVPHKNLPSWIKTISIAPLLSATIKNLTKNWLRL